MTENFKAALDFLMMQECPGGDRQNCKSNLWADAGRKTNQGIIQATYDGYRMAAGEPLRDVFEMTDNEAELIYLKRFWLRGSCDIMPHPLDILHFDACANHGTELITKFGVPKVSAQKLLQTAAGVEADGMIGPQTLIAIEHQPVEIICLKYICVRMGQYWKLAQSPTQEQFLAGGWLLRLMNFYDQFLK